MDMYSVRGQTISHISVASLKYNGPGFVTVKNYTYISV